MDRSLVDVRRDVNRIQRLIFIGSHVPKKLTRSVIQMGRLDIIKDIYENNLGKITKKICLIASMYGHLNILIYAHTVMKSQWTPECMALAAGGGHFECLKYMIDNKCPTDSLTCRYAAAAGNLECLRYAYEHGCPMDQQVIDSCAYYGHLECLQYAWKQGCSYTSEACRVASENGHLECLKFLHENGCPWTEDTTSYAAMNDHVECLIYAVEEGCPVDDNAWLNSVKYTQDGGPCLEYLIYRFGRPSESLMNSLYKE